MRSHVRIVKGATPDIQDCSGSGPRPSPPSPPAVAAVICSKTVKLYSDASRALTIFFKLGKGW